MDTSHNAHEVIRFLEKKIADLPLSEVTKNISARMGYFYLSDLVSDGWSVIANKEHFSYKWFLEITLIFDEKGLLQLLEGED